MTAALSDRFGGVTGRIPGLVTRVSGTGLLT